MSFPPAADADYGDVDFFVCTQGSHGEGAAEKKGSAFHSWNYFIARGTKGSGGNPRIRAEAVLMTQFRAKACLSTYTQPNSQPEE